MSSTRQPRGRARARAAGAVIVGGLLVAACGDPVETASPEVTSEDLERVRDEVADLEDRVAALERQADSDAEEPVEEPEAPDPRSAFLDDPSAFVGERVTARGEVVELVASTDVASAIGIAGDAGEPVVVVSVTPPPPLRIGDAIEVSGTAVEVDPDTFEADFGISADELFDDPEEWLAEAEGQVGIAAVRIEAATEPDED